VFRQGSGPKRYPEKGHDVKHLPKRAVYFLVEIFTRFSTAVTVEVWNHARVIYILKPWKDPALPPSYQQISLLDMIGKLFEKLNYPGYYIN